MDQTDTATAVRRTAEMAAIFMVGDGLIGIVQPERHVALWRSRHASIDTLVRPFDGRPARRRVYGVLQVAVGLVLAARLVAPPREGRG